VRLGLESFQPAPFVTNFTDPKAARKWYRKRFSIETLFADVKSRGFNLDKTRFWIPEGLNRLILAVAIAYIFTVSVKPFGSMLMK
jgi:hypothetical protein